MIRSLMPSSVVGRIPPEKNDKKKKKKTEASGPDVSVS